MSVRVENGRVFVTPEVQAPLEQELSPNTLRNEYRKLLAYRNAVPKMTAKLAQLEAMFSNEEVLRAVEQAFMEINKEK